MSRDTVLPLLLLLSSAPRVSEPELDLLTPWAAMLLLPLLLLALLPLLLRTLSRLERAEEQLLSPLARQVWQR